MSLNVPTGVAIPDPPLFNEPLMLWISDRIESEFWLNHKANSLAISKSGLRSNCVRDPLMFKLLDPWKSFTRAFLSAKTVPTDPLKSSACSTHKVTSTERLVLSVTSSTRFLISRWSFFVMMVSRSPTRVMTPRTSTSASVSMSWMWSMSTKEYLIFGMAARVSSTWVTTDSMSNQDCWW